MAGPVRNLHLKQETRRHSDASSYGDASRTGGSHFSKLQVVAAWPQGCGSDCSARAGGQVQVGFEVSDKNRRSFVSSCVRERSCPQLRFSRKSKHTLIPALLSGSRHSWQCTCVQDPSSGAVQHGATLFGKAVHPELVDLIGVNSGCPDACRQSSGWPLLVERPAGRPQHDGAARIVQSVDDVTGLPQCRAAICNPRERTWP